MDTMTTTQHLGQAPGSALRCASAVVAGSSWRQRSIAPAICGRDATGVVEFPMNAYLGNTTTLAGAKNHSFVKRHTRHLGRGST